MACCSNRGGGWSRCLFEHLRGGSTFEMSSKALTLPKCCGKNRMDNSWNMAIFIAHIFNVYYLVSLDYKMFRNRTKVRYIIQDSKSNWILKNYAWRVHSELKSHHFEGRNVIFVVKKFNLSTFVLQINVNNVISHKRWFKGLGYTSIVPMANHDAAEICCMWGASSWQRTFCLFSSASF